MVVAESATTAREPRRCGIMTGSYNQRFGIQWNDDRGKHNVGPHKLLPQALKTGGYVTGHIGKWAVPVLKLTKPGESP
jgi:arylsulfatase A-like enzyme